jgi:hypothetical protein
MKTDTDRLVKAAKRAAKRPTDKRVERLKNTLEDVRGVDVETLDWAEKIMLSAGDLVRCRGNVPGEKEEEPQGSSFGIPARSSAKAGKGIR